MGDDDNKKEYCEIQADSLDDKKKGLERTVSDAEKAIADAKESISTLASEVKALEDGVKALDKSTAEATEQRKDENSDFTELIAQDTAAKEILGMAKNRLNKFYNPKLYVAPELAQIQAHGQQTAAPPPPPEAPGAYSKKSEESNGVIAMVDTIIKDLDKEIQEMEFEEKDAQEDYENFVEDSANKRATDSKSLTDKEAAKADAEANLIKLEDETKNKMTENMNTMESLEDFHLDCDWLLQNFDTRKEARTGEIDALKKAKAVLSGADFSLIQTAHVHRHV